MSSDALVADSRALDGRALGKRGALTRRRLLDATATLLEDAEHAYAADVAVLRPGLWEFRVTAARGDESFTAVVDRDAPGDLR